MIGQHLDTYTYENLIKEALAQVPDTVDKRQGSIIYDTLAVGDAQLAQGYIELKGYYLDSYALTATGEHLENRVAEAGLSRYPATKAVRKGIFETSTGEPPSFSVLGDVRFSTAEDVSPLTYRVISVYTENGETVPGCYQLECETPGAAGNAYHGTLVPITHLSNLARAEMVGDALIPGSDEETDDELRIRYLEAVNRPAFGGNVAQYRQWVREVEGVGEVQVYPVWNGGGTVKVSVIGSDSLPASQALIQRIQDTLYPLGDEGDDKELGYGLAPIGHIVTVSAPERVPIRVRAEVTLAPGVSLDQVQDAVERNIAAYLEELRRQFGTTGDGRSYAMHVYRARINSAMIAVSGVENVTGILLWDESVEDWVDGDLELRETAELQQLPILESVELNQATVLFSDPSGGR